MENLPNNLNEQKESPDLCPEVLDVVMIDGRLGQVCSRSPEERNITIKYFDETDRLYRINLNEYDYSGRPSGFTIGDLRKNGELSDAEYLAIAWDSGPEQEANPYIRDNVTYLGKFTKKE